MVGLQNAAASGIAMEQQIVGFRAYLLNPKLRSAQRCLVGSQKAAASGIAIEQQIVRF